MLRRHYARVEELAPYLGLVAAQGEVYVQFWLRPGDAAVGISFGEEGHEQVIPEVLKLYLCDRC